MPKYKNLSDSIIRFDEKGKEKALEPGKTYELEATDYVEGLAATGVLELKVPEEAPAEKAPAEKNVKSTPSK